MQLLSLIKVFVLQLVFLILFGCYSVSLKEKVYFLGGIQLTLPAAANLKSRLATPAS